MKLSKIRLLDLISNAPRANKKRYSKHMNNGGSGATIITITDGEQHTSSSGTIITTVNAADVFKLLLDGSHIVFKIKDVHYKDWYLTEYSANSLDDVRQASIDGTITAGSVVAAFHIYSYNPGDYLECDFKISSIPDK